MSWAVRNRFLAIWAAVLAASTPAVAVAGDAKGAAVLTVLGSSQAMLPEAGLAPDGGEAGGATISIGRAQDIVGVPIDFSRVRPRLTASGSAGLAALRGLPSSVAVPSRLPLASGRLTSGYGMRQHPLLGGSRLHSGVDIAAPAGSPIYAPTAGVVSGAGWNGGYGLSVTIEHGGGLQTRYGHMSRLAVTAGQSVKAGEVIGYVGSTGLSTGPHLHYEIRRGGAALNPLSGR